MAIPATSGRVLSNVCMTPENPPLGAISGLPSSASLGTRQSWRRKAAVSGELLLVGHRRDGGLTEPLSGHAEQQPDVAPAQLDEPEQAGHVGAVAIAVAARAVGGRCPASDRACARAAQRARVVHAVDQ